jgi:hypothetical protein
MSRKNFTLRLNMNVKNETRINPFKVVATTKEYIPNVSDKNTMKRIFITLANKDTNSG